ncbi:hypothetical protein K435DRAFT_345091 [Dendrothele bispora CBS 962.96]|uniref:DUF6534 domain-containing protein n=1 Tax=Dendrothele bispora (strain CBS 962.96) TaxID=1314807 RepID=A0A4V4HHG6_DENBC|nr:hypothetical protein K435DRAFT_345091 [Dendrothele bispora CBS 962.96]
MVHTNTGLTLGAFLLGQIITSVLFGLLTSQTYLYFYEFSEDSKKVKFAVATVWLLELAHIVCSSWGLYNDTVDHFGHPEHLFQVSKVFLMSLLIAGFIFPLVQLSFAERIYRISGNRYIVAFLIFMTVVRFIGSLANFAVFWTSESIIDYTARYSWFIPALLGMGVVTDLTIAMTLVFYFRQQRVRIFKSTVKVIDTLTLWTIESGVATTIVGVASVLTTVLLSDTCVYFSNWLPQCLNAVTDVWIALLLVITRLYSNMLLASFVGFQCLLYELHFTIVYNRLNGRTRLRAIKEDSIVLNTSRNRPTSLGMVFKVMSESHDPVSPTNTRRSTTAHWEDQKSMQSPLSPAPSTADLERVLVEERPSLDDKTTT